MLPQEIRLLAHGKALLNQGSTAIAIEIFERLLRDPITGRVRRDPARRLGELLLEGNGIPPDRVRAVALLFEAVLGQEQEVAVALGSSHLSPDPDADLEIENLDPMAGA